MLLVSYALSIVCNGYPTIRNSAHMIPGLRSGPGTFEKARRDAKSRKVGPPNLYNKKKFLVKYAVSYHLHRHPTPPAAYGASA